MKPYLIPALLLASVLAGCATAPHPASPPTTRPGAGGLGNQPAPAGKPLAIPNAEWVIMGVTPNGNILHEVDKLSLQRRGTLVQFRDRKTIFNPKKENFLNTPRHKQSINHWEVDCAAATFRLNRMILLDDNGREIINRTYNDNEIRAMPVVRQSAGFQQVDYVCKQQG
ncbi:surface-adhesin E family protein [Vogesella mureinivorans]|uniref:surface-adhesin E family protein n=1 Tax=Vogesella mureinivorans TaxID=657276 RepID=UPI0011CA9085|nr:surface-adhesin E family protein [Vogesella mureinivorans]